ncbi:hypothetical protein E4T66_12345 [Sinimarinibacterium sp. CAU 1509]|uniref:hypothetical protein n=1 Tax=Sinimarinibacterium sp. CAU 1509 TaxID=2562283 RepID=UPI0010AB926A|nr:hypothetical protein [Sinimarinibacterium sp. CAU 1509]TJY59965.1 hypothetical protein E4T66_12345 [Sinimarinibacterium sp. CAU 1509]
MNTKRWLGLRQLAMTVLVVIGLSAATMATAQFDPRFSTDRSAQKLACPNAGEVRALIDGKLICVRPVVGLDADESRRVPNCNGAQTLVRSADGRFFCVDGDLGESAKPVCFNGGSPIRKTDGSFVCRRAATDAGKPDLEVTLIEAHGCTDGVSSGCSGSSTLNVPLGPQAASIRVRVRNIGTRDSEATQLIFGFPPNAPFKGDFTFLDPREFCVGRLASTPDLAPVCADTHGEYAFPISSSLDLNAGIDVPRLAPRAEFVAYAIVRRKTPMASFPKTDLVDRTQLFARVNDGRRFDELRFENNQVVVDVRLRD